MMFALLFAHPGYAAAPSPTSREGVCLRNVAAVAEAEAAGDPVDARKALGPCGSMPEARLQLCLSVILHGARALADQCPGSLADAPVWAAEAHVAAGARALHEGDAKGAREHFDAAVSADPDQPRARVGLILTGTGTTAKAQAKLLAAHPGDVRGPADLVLNDPLRAEIRLVDALINRLDPACVDCQGRLAYLLAQWVERHHGPLDDRSWRRAVSALRVVLAAEPGDFDSRLTLGDSLNMLADYKAVADVYEAGLRLKPDWTEGASNAAQAWLWLRHPEIALPLLDRVVQQTPGDAMAWYRLGLARRALGRKDAADALRKAVNDPRTENDARLALGQVLLDAGDAAGAAEQLEKVVVAAPDRAPAHFGLSRAMRLKGDAAGADAAMAAFRGALERTQAKNRVDEADANRAHSFAATLDLLAAGNVDEAAREIGLASPADRRHAFYGLAHGAVVARQKHDPSAVDVDAIVRLCGEAQAQAQAKAPTPAAAPEGPPQ